MANTKQAKKRVRQAETHRQLNASQRSAMRTRVKDLRKLIATGDIKSANEAFPKTASILDKAVNKGLIHRNTAARYKSRLNAKLKAVAQANANQ